MLYLIEDFRGEDRNKPNDRMSGYTALLMMLSDRHLAPNLVRTELGSREHAAAFASRPRELITELGGRVGPRRGIYTLYRVRDTLIEMKSDAFRGAVATIGYPIFITEQPRLLGPYP